MNKDMERAEYLKKLYDKHLDAADSKLSLKERMAYAEKKMDKSLGEEWRHELKKPEIEFIEIVVDVPTKAPEDHKKFYKKAREEGDEKGLGPKGSEAPEEHELSEKEMDAKCIKELLHEILEKLD